MSTITTTSPSATSPTSSKLDLYACWGMWALPVWTLLLFLGTLTHQPSYQTDFPAYARYVTTTEFLISHLVASIFGAGVGILGLTALFIVLCKGRAAPLALWALVTGVIANMFTTAVFGVAAGDWPRLPLWAHGRGSGDQQRRLRDCTERHGPARALALHDQSRPVRRRGRPLRLPTEAGRHRFGGRDRGVRAARLLSR